ncbi:hypothetical protein ACLH0C_19405, partial [Aeromonas rivipollensis]
MKKPKRLPLHNNKWVRRIHAWAGFATLTLMLLYGLTGLWLQHRAVLPLPGPHTEKSSEEITLAAPLASPDADEPAKCRARGSRLGGGPADRLPGAGSGKAR